MAVPYTFGSATTSIPLSQLDSNFATAITLGNTAVQLGNTITNLTGVTNLASSGALTLGSNGNTTAVTIDTSQNVSIGTASSLSRLSVNYAGNGSGYLRATQGELIINTENSGLAEGPGLSFGHFSATAPEIVGRIATIRLGYPAMRMAFMFRAGGSGTGDFATSDERITILSNGYVGIANTNPAYPLTLNGQPAANGYTAWTNYSDSRLKENIVDFEPTGALSKVVAMRPVSFNYNELSGFSEEARARTVSGFIAQELQVICPEMVGTREIDNEEYLDTNTSNLSLYLVKAIQELKAINDTQAETINALTARIVALEAK